MNIKSYLVMGAIGLIAIAIASRISSVSAIMYNTASAS